MDTPEHDVDILWTAELAVGCVALDQRNRLMLAELARSSVVIAASDSAVLTEWLLARFAQLELLLLEEEHELEAAGYPELAFHRRLHDLARGIVRDARSQLQRVQTPEALAVLARASCDALGRWLPRHIVDADRLFFPYVDQRFRFA